MVECLLSIHKALGSVPNTASQKSQNYNLQDSPPKQRNFQSKMSKVLKLRNPGVGIKSLNVTPKALSIKENTW
jgi:hypothetical protein